MTNQRYRRMGEWVCDFVSDTCYTLEDNELYRVVTKDKDGTTWTLYMGADQLPHELQTFLQLGG